MNKFTLGFLVAVLTLGTIWFLFDRKAEKEELHADSAMIQQQIQQVGKLIVTEGYYSQVFTFKNSQNLFMDLIKSNKKALVVANAKATVEYDLRELETEIDIQNKTVTITKIPEPVVNIYPDFEYYDVTQDYLNQFDAKDYNKVKKSVNAHFRKKIDSSGLKDDAEQRLMSELLSIYILTNNLGWTLVYNDVPIESTAQMENLSR